MSNRFLVLALACAVMAAGLAEAQSPGAQAIRARRANLNALLASYKIVNDQLKRSDPDLAAIRMAAQRMDQMAARLPSWFPPGSGEEAGDTKAKAVVWTDPAGFRRKAADLGTAVGRLEAEVRTGDVGRIRSAQRAVSATCTSCHDVYEEPFY